MRGSRTLARTVICTLSLTLAAAGMVAFASAADAGTVYQQVSTINVGHSVGEVAIDTGEQRAYVTDGADNLVTVIDTTNNSVAGTIPIGTAPTAIAVDSVRHFAYVTSYNAMNVTVIDTTTDTITRTIGVSNSPWGVAVDPTTGLVYVAVYWGGQTLAVIDPSTTPAGETESSIIGSRPFAVAVDPTTHLTYVSTLFGDQVTVMNGTTIGDQIGSYVGPTHLAIDPAANRLYVNRSGGVSVIDTSDDTPLPDAPSGNSPAETSVDTSTHVGYTTNSGDNTVTVFDTLTNQTIATVPVTHQPGSSAVDPTTHKLYVSNSDNTISVIKPLATQAISVSSSPPANAIVGDSYIPAATAPGGTVSFSVEGTSCRMSGTTVELTHPGTCTVDFNQSGNANTAAAPQVQQTINVNAIGSTVTVSAPGSVYGEATHATATITPARGDADGTVTFSVDGHQLGNPVNVVNGTADSADLVDDQGQPLSAASHTIGATFTPSNSDYSVASNTATDVVNKANSAVALTITPGHITASVSAVAPGVGTPTGTVDFAVDGQSIGSANVVSGLAQLDQDVAPGSTRNVSATYSGDGSFNGASGSTSRQDPSITATIVASPPRHNGWYRGGVRVRFSCASNGAPLTTPCPATRIFGHQGAAQSVTRTILAADGGAATVTVGNVNIDHTLPSVALRGARGRSVHRGAPRVGCVSNDRLSGVASCVLTRHTKSIAVGQVITYRVTATDKAGNRRTKSGRYTVLTRWFAGAKYQRGAFLVRPGHTYRFVVTDGKTRPTYYWAAIAPHRPTRTSTGFHHTGTHRWVLRVRMDPGMRSHPLWNVGVRIGRTLHVIRVRVLH